MSTLRFACEKKTEFWEDTHQIIFDVQAQQCTKVIANVEYIDVDGDGQFGPPMDIALDYPIEHVILDEDTCCMKQQNNDSTVDLACGHHTHEVDTYSFDRETEECTKTTTV